MKGEGGRNMAERRGMRRGQGRQREQKYANKRLNCDVIAALM